MSVTHTINGNRRLNIATAAAISISTLLISACQTTVPSNPPTLVERGEQLFLNETFLGNGRTCGSCHQPADNFGLSPAFAATLPNNDPLFVAEFNPDLGDNFENPALMREFGLILENQDGFGDLDNNFNMRGVPHTLAMKNSIDSPGGPPHLPRRYCQCSYIYLKRPATARLGQIVPLSPERQSRVLQVVQCW